MTPKIAVLYTTGAYGSFISWIFYTFSNLNQENCIKIPFNGSNAHGYRDTCASNNIVSPVDVNKISEFQQSCKNILILEYNDFDKSINYQNNILEKCFLNDIDIYLTTVFPDYKVTLSRNWGETNYLNLREFLSLSITAMINSNLSKFQNQIVNIDDKENKKIYSISPEKLLLDIKNNGNELFNLFDFFKISPNKFFPEVNNYVSDYLDRQKFFNRSVDLYNYFIDISSKISTNLQDLTIIDEAFIQQKLWQTALDETTRDYVYNTLGYTYREIQNDK